MTERATGSMHTRRATVFVGAFALLALAQGCGAKTGLRIPDVNDDVVEETADAFDVVDAPDVVDVPDVDVIEACVPGRFPLRPREAEVLFLIDRSNSMEAGLDGGRPTSPDQTRWAVLTRALELALPPFQNSIPMGAVFFPRPSPANEDRLEVLCGVEADVTVRPARMNALAITRVLRTTQPRGGTPTFLAIDAARRYFNANPDRARARYMVMATDGGPNCNLSLNQATCVCTSRDPNTMVPDCPMHDQSQNCLDDTRTLAAMRASTASGIPTYVIGIDDPMRPDLTAVLDRMAVAGGRPSMDGSATRYYSVRRPADLANAFASIQRDIAQCAFVTPSRPDDPDAIRIEINGATVPRDLTHTQGWDWTDRAFGEITFFGSACDNAAMAPTGVTARVGCDTM